VTNRSRCPSMTPQALCGDLGPLQCALPLTARNEPHAGHHRVTRHIAGVGKASYRWKSGVLRSRVQQPPVIELPVPSSEYLNPRAPHRSDVTVV
jgi:hypothetical protein